jgi:hypothetical protein
MFLFRQEVFDPAGSGHWLSAYLTERTTSKTNYKKCKSSKTQM